MAAQAEHALQTCSVCRAQVSELRRGRCWGCYNRWAESRPVGLGAACAVCNERRRDYLKMVEMHGRSMSLCFNCAGRVAKLPVIPTSIEALRERIQRDRRGKERRGTGIERRVYPRERRVGDRRAPAAARTAAPYIGMPDLDDVVIELTEDDVEVVEATMVLERPKPASS